LIVECVRGGKKGFLSSIVRVLMHDFEGKKTKVQKSGDAAA
jgi:hypothetical protein